MRTYHNKIDDGEILEKVVYSGYEGEWDTVGFGDRYFRDLAFGGSTPFSVGESGRVQLSTFATSSSAPEPTSLALMVVGLIGIGFMRHRKSLV